MPAEAIGDLLPAALAVALSPIPIVAVILLLGGSRARTTGPAFAVGWTAALLAVTVIVLLLAGGSSDPDRDDPGLGWLKIAIGVLFLVMALRQWRRRPGAGAEPETPGWMKIIDQATAGRALALGAALAAVNPKNLALTVATAASITEDGLDSAEEAIAIAVFVLIASATIAGAVLYRLLAGERAAAPLASLKRFMADHNAVIVMIILLLLGAKLLGEGIGAV